MAGLARRVTHRSLLILYTSFTSMSALRRQLTYLRQLARRHRLLVVFFEDQELRDFASRRPSASRLSGETLSRLSVGSERGSLATYQRVIAEKFLYEQRLIVSTLRQYGIQALLSTPQNLSVDVINRYLEIKSH
jgi:hypothetical protein